MNIAKTKASAYATRFGLPLLWAMGIGGVVAWAGCSSVTTGGSSSGDTASNGNSMESASSTGNSSSSSGMPIECNGGPDCPGGPPSSGSPCPTPGECCGYITCDHMGGVGSMDVACTDGGVWQKVQ